MTKNNHTYTRNKAYKKYVEQTIKKYNSNGKKTIVHFCDCYYPIIDGVIKVVENYAKHQSKEYNVVLIVPQHKNKIIVNSKYLVIGVTSIFFKFINYDLALPRLDNFLFKSLKLLNINLIHAHSAFSLGDLASKVATKRKIPMVITMHSQYKPDFVRHTNNNQFLVNALLKNVVRIYSKSTEVWAMHQKVAEVLKSYGYKKNNFFFIPNATDYKIPKNPESLNDIVNQKYNISPTTPVFCFVGRIVAQKNIFFILESLKILKSQNFNFKMFFVGDGPDLNNLKASIKKLNLENHVILAGRIDDRHELSAYYQRSNLFLFPSTYDTSSLVQIEAATYKTPGVFIENTATANTITNNHNGFICKEDPYEYANIIKQALSNKIKLKEIAENAHNELYVSWKAVAKTTINRYKQLMESNSYN